MPPAILLVNYLEYSERSGHQSVRRQNEFGEEESVERSRPCFSPLSLKQSRPGVRIDDPKGNPSINRRWEEGHYANFFQIGHNAFEFLLEFGQQEGEQSAIHTRIYVSPQHARILANLLLDSLQQHERIFGKIRNAGSSGSGTNETE